MDKINKIQKYNLYVIEDCAEAIGSKFQNKNIGTSGDCQFLAFMEQDNYNW